MPVDSDLAIISHAQEHELKDIAEEVAKIQSLYGAAVYEKNVTSLLRLYDPKVRVFDAWGLWQYIGIESWQVSVEGWLKSLGSARVKVSFDETQVLGTMDLAVASAFVTFSNVLDDGSELRSMQNRITWSLKTSGHNLRIVHEHTSAPIGFEDMKAILVRER